MHQGLHFLHEGQGLRPVNKWKFPEKINLVLLGRWAWNNENINLQGTGILPGQTGQGRAEQSCLGTPTGILVALCGRAELGRCQAIPPTSPCRGAGCGACLSYPSPTKGLQFGRQATKQEIKLLRAACQAMAAGLPAAQQAQELAKTQTPDRARTSWLQEHWIQPTTFPFLKTDLPTQASRPGRDTGNAHTLPGLRASSLLCDHNLG